MKKYILFTLLIFFIFSSIIFLARAAECKPQYHFRLESNTVFSPYEDAIVSFMYSYYSYKQENNDISLTVNITLYRVNDPESFFLKIKEAEFDDIIAPDSSNLLYECSEVRTQIKEFDPKTNYKPQPLNFYRLQRGAYIVKVAGEYNVAYAGFIVSGMDIVSKFSGRSMLTLIAEKGSGKPVDEGSVSIYYDSVLFASGAVKNGVFFYTYKHEIDTAEIDYSNAYKKVIVMARSGEDFIVSQANVFFSGFLKQLTAEMYTNQSVYRTNSEVFFKCIIRKEEYNTLEPFRNKKVTCVIKDPRGTEMYRKELETNINGSITGNIFIDKEAPLGGYEVLLSYGRNSFFSEHFIVEQYKKPEYKVTVEPDKKRYEGSGKIKATVKADYYFGSPVSEGEVKYSIHKTPFYKPWWAFSEYAWWYQSFYSSETMSGSRNYNTRIIHEGTGTLDKDGKFVIEYMPDEDFKVYMEGDEFYETDYSYSIYVLVKDKSRREIGASASALVTRGEFYLTTRADRNYYMPGDKAHVEVKALDFTDKPQAASFTAALYRTEYYSYENEHENRELVKTFTGTIKETEKGAIFYDVDETGGYYNLVIESKDSKGRVIKDNVSFYAGRYRWAEESSNSIQIATDKEGYITGDTCRVFIDSPQKDVYPLITCEGKDIIDYRIEHISEDIFSYSFVLDERFPGNFNIRACLVKNGKYYEGTKSVLFIPEKKFLNVEITPSSGVYRPQDTGEVKVRVTDSEGEPVKDAEISLGVTDESIYYINPDDTEDLRQSFYFAHSSEYTAQTEFARVNSNIYPSRQESIAEKLFLKKFNDSTLVRVNGRYIDENSDPVNGASIIINGTIKAAETDYKGYFSFRIPPGYYMVGAESFDEKRYLLRNIDVAPGKDNSFLLFDAPSMNISDKYVTKGKGKIAGYVYDMADHTPLAGAIVRIEGTSIGVETDAKGYYVIAGLDEGTYDVSAAYIGYNRHTIVSVKVANEFTTYLNNYLEAAIGIKTYDIIVEGTQKSIEFEQSGRILAREEISNSGILGLNNIASITSGVVTDVNGVNINIRGSRNSEHTVIIDEVAVLEGGIGAEYGNVMSGVINVTRPNYKKAALRSEFKDAIYWSPFITTDETGTGTIRFKYPDNLTSWRMTAKVVTGDSKFGQSKINVVTRKDFIVRAEAPRFLQQNDEVIISTIIHNYLDTPKKTKIKVTGENVFLKDNLEKEINVGPGEDVRLDWPVRVLEASGVAKVYAEALTDEESDAIEIPIPIQPKGLKQNVTSISDISEVYKTEEINVSIPEGTDINSARMKLSVSPSLGAFVYKSIEKLADYPYGCIEQTLSKFIPTIVAADTYKRLGIPVNEDLEKELPLMISKGFSKISAYQRKDGGWGWWNNEGSDPFISAYVVYALTLAKNAGYDVDKNLHNKGIRFLRNKFENRDISNVTRAFMLYSYSLAEDTIPAVTHTADEIYSEETNSFTKVLLALVNKNTGNTGRAMRILEELEVSADTSHDGYISWGGVNEQTDHWEHDRLQMEAFALKAFTLIKPASDIKERIVRNILSERNSEYIPNTQREALLVYALTDYMAVSNELKPDYKVQIYVNDKLLLEKVFTANDIYSKETVVPVEPGILKAGSNVIRIVKEGAGKVYFSSLTSYFTRGEKFKAAEKGFDVKREYFKLEQVKVESENENERNETSYIYKKIGIEEPLKPGEIVFVKTTVDTRGRNYKYFMLEDPMPAGFELVKDEWAYPVRGEEVYTHSYLYDEDAYWKNRYTHREVWDDRISFFLSGINGKHEFTYILRAQIPGDYYVNPARGMLMYYTGISGNSGDYRIKVAD